MSIPDEMVERGAEALRAASGVVPNLLSLEGIATRVLAAALVITDELVEKVARGMCVNPDDCWPFWKDSARAALRAAGFGEEA